MTEKKIQRIWNPVTLEGVWLRCDTSLIDDILPSWMERRELLQNNSTEYKEFIERLKREHAIETGIVERLYDLDKGITETLIQNGINEAYISHGDTNIETPKLLRYLRDHLNAVDFVFDMVKQNRELTVGFIKELHALVTHSQEFVEGRDQDGKRTRLPLLKGQYKLNENNPSREDGTTFLYCPPEHVASEMDALVRIYREGVETGIHFMILTSWFHHAFTTIHPFQDGNGRVARLLTSLMLIRNGNFPFTVMRDEAKNKYIAALELADQGIPNHLLDYFMENQKRNIEKALNLKEVSETTLEGVADILSKKLENHREKLSKDRALKLDANRVKVFNFCDFYVRNKATLIKLRLNGNVSISVDSCPPSDNSRNHYYYGQVIKYAKEHNYYFNRTLPKAWVTFRVSIGNRKTYQLGITIHHQGYGDTLMVVGAFLEYLEGGDMPAENPRVESSLPLVIKPYVLSINKETEEIGENGVNSFLEEALTLMLAHIASEI